MYYVLRLLHHLALGNPKGGLGNGDGKIVDLDAIELPNRDLNGIAYIQHDLAFVQERNSFVFQPPQRDIGFGEEVPGSAGRVYVHTDFDTKEKALSGAKAAEKGLK